MPEYIMLFRLTQKGAENIKESPQRLKAAKKIFEEGGAKVKAIYAVLGKYDFVHIVEAADDETIARLSLQISSLGNVHTETWRAFSEDQYLSILNKLP